METSGYQEQRSNTYTEMGKNGHRMKRPNGYRSGDYEHASQRSRRVGMHDDVPKYDSRSEQCRYWHRNGENRLYFNHGGYGHYQRRENNTTQTTRCERDRVSRSSIRSKEQNKDNQRYQPHSKDDDPFLPRERGSSPDQWQRSHIDVLTQRCPANTARNSRDDQSRSDNLPVAPGQLMYSEAVRSTPRTDSRQGTRYMEYNNSLRDNGRQKQCVNHTRSTETGKDEEPLHTHPDSATFVPNKSDSDTNRGAINKSDKSNDKNRENRHMRGLTCVRDEVGENMGTEGRQTQDKETEKEVSGNIETEGRLTQDKETEKEFSGNIGTEGRLTGDMRSVKDSSKIIGGQTRHPQDNETEDEVGEIIGAEGSQSQDNETEDEVGETVEAEGRLRHDTEKDSDTNSKYNNRLLLNIEHTTDTRVSNTVDRVPEMEGLPSVPDAGDRGRQPASNPTEEMGKSSDTESGNSLPAKPPDAPSSRRPVQGSRSCSRSRRALRSDSNQKRAPSQSSITDSFRKKQVGELGDCTVTNVQTKNAASCTPRNKSQ